MSLNAPNLDDRKFQDIVDDVKRQIGLRCPEWTDHNVSDPGVTLIELFAWMTEMMLFRLNQVPEKNYLTFLEMLGITLESPQPARTDLLYRLVPPIPDSATSETDAYLLELKKQFQRGMIAATRRTDTEEAIEFTTEADIRWVRPALQYVLAVGAHDETDAQEVHQAYTRARLLPPTKGSNLFNEFSVSTEGELFYVFQEPDLDSRRRRREDNTRRPLQNDALYLGFTSNVSRHVIALQVSGVGKTGIGMDPKNPLQRWECYTGEVGNPWKPVKVVKDEIEGFDREGTIELALPQEIVERSLQGANAFWVRCRYIGASNDYTYSPALTAISAITTGALVPAANFKVLKEETLGFSDGTPGQSLRLRFAPLLALEGERGETLRVGEKIWEIRPNFAESGPEDRHFTCDYITGEIRFGPSIMQPDGSARQYGEIPPKGQKIVLNAYRYGGDARGNVREMQICIDKDNRQFVADVTNPDVATGGRDLEHVERAKMRARAMLQMRHRAVTPEDFDFLALESSRQVGRARCLRRENLPQLQEGIKQLRAERNKAQALVKSGDYTRNSEKAQPIRQQIERLEDRIKNFEEALNPGVVCVLVVPAFGMNILTPGLKTVIPDTFPNLARNVKEYLDTKRLLTTKVLVMHPDYVRVSIHIKVASDIHRDKTQVAYRVKESLNRLMHPLGGGEDGHGWQFGRRLTVADIYTRVSAVEGVAFLTPPTIIRHTEQDGMTEAHIEDGTVLEILPHQLLLTENHQVEVVPLPYFGGPEEQIHREIV